MLVLHFSIKFLEESLENKEGEQMDHCMQNFVD